MNYYTTVKQDPNLVYANFTGSDLASTAGKAVAELCYEGVYLISGAPTNTPHLYIPGAIVHNAIDGNNYENKGTTASPNFTVMATGTGITALTGDVTATGPGSVVATIGAGKVTGAKLVTGSGYYVVAVATNGTTGVNVFGVTDGFNGTITNIKVTAQDTTAGTITIADTAGVVATIAKGTVAGIVTGATTLANTSFTSAGFLTIASSTAGNAIVEITFKVA